MRPHTEGEDIMGHTPYGYRIENGIAVINESEAECVRQIFAHYISGMSMTEAAKAAGHPAVHSSVKRILRRACYCGDDFYPAIIDTAVFQKANSELKERAANKNQTGKKRRITPKPETEFIFLPPQTHYDDPYQQAEYLYGLIESKVVKCQK